MLKRMAYTCIAVQRYLMTIIYHTPLLLEDDSIFLQRTLPTDDIHLNVQVIAFNNRTDVMKIQIQSPRNAQYDSLFLPQLGQLLTKVLSVLTLISVSSKNYPHSSQVWVSVSRNHSLLMWVIGRIRLEVMVVHSERFYDRYQFNRFPSRFSQANPGQHIAEFSIHIQVISMGIS